MLINPDYYQMCIMLDSILEPDLKILFPSRVPPGSEGNWLWVVNFPWRKVGFPLVNPKQDFSRQMNECFSWLHPIIDWIQRWHVCDWVSYRYPFSCPFCSEQSVHINTFDHIRSHFFKGRSPKEFGIPVVFLRSCHVTATRWHEQIDNFPAIQFWLKRWF